MFIKHLSIAALLLSGATAAYADPRGGFDSVNQDFEDIVADINDEFATGSARFANIAINTGDVDASVTINANLDEGGEFSSFRSTFFDKDFESTGADISDGAATMEMSMGSISTLAAGALNTVTMDLTEAAAASSFDVASGSVAAAGSTVSASAYDRGVTPGRRIAPCGGVRMEVLAGSDTRHDTTPAHPPRGKRTWTWHHVAANASPTDGSLAPVRDPQAATRAIGNAVITEGV